MRRGPLVAFNLLFLHPRLAGVRRYALGLAPRFIELNDTFDVALLLPNHAETVAEVRSAVVTAKSQANPVHIERIVCAPARKAPMFLVENFILPGVLRRLDVRLLISLDYHGPILTRVPQVITVHDLKVRDLPHTFGWPQRLVRRIVLPLLTRQASQIWTISHFSAERIRTHYTAAASKIRIVGSGVDIAGPMDVKPDTAQAAREEYFLSVGTFTPHKNHTTLLRAFLRHSGPERLVLVGARGPALRDPELQNLLREAGQRVAIHYDMPDLELAAMFRGAKAYVTTSLYEGFGMTILEAMRNGVPVACSNVTALPEVAGGAALTFDPRDAGAVTVALAALSTSAALRDDLVTRGCARILQFEWSGAAERALDACRELVGDVRR